MRGRLESWHEAKPVQIAAGTSKTAARTIFASNVANPGSDGPHVFGSGVGVVAHESCISGGHRRRLFLFDAGTAYLRVLRIIRLLRCAVLVHVRCHPLFLAAQSDIA